MNTWPVGIFIYFPTINRWSNFLQKKTPTIKTPRVLRGLLILGSYAMTPLYRPGSQHCDGDNLSRAIAAGASVSSEDYDIDPHVVLLLNDLNDCAVYALSEGPVSASAVALPIPEDLILRQVMAWCLAGWPDQDPGRAFSPYYARRDFNG